MGWGLYIIGDEILSGRRRDKHFERVQQLLAARGEVLAWCQYLGDERERLIAAFRASLGGGDIVFSCGGIGVTPDDHTRQAAAAALGTDLVLHPEAEREIRARFGDEVTAARLELGTFPRGADIIPNPVNRVPGFSLGHHHFVPGFPEMAWPMIEWLLDQRYAAQRSSGYHESAVRLPGVRESDLIPLMQALEARYPEIKVFSLPSFGGEGMPPHVELGAKGPPEQVRAAFLSMQEGLRAAGHAFELLPERPLGKAGG